MLIPHLYATGQLSYGILTYQILQPFEPRTAYVTYELGTYGDEGYTYRGTIKIPRTVSDKHYKYTVVEIGELAFAHSFPLPCVEIPNTVTSIKYRAFYDCLMLSHVEISDSVTSIGEEAFRECPSLKTVTLPKSLSYLGTDVFYDCMNLEYINVDPQNEQLSSIDGIVYNKDATALLVCPGGKRTVTIPNSVISIAKRAFVYCRNLTSVMIPNSVISIGESAFELCYDLRAVTIPNSVTSIGRKAFYNCTNLNSLTIGNSVTSIGIDAFYGCSGLTSVTIPNSVTSIGGRAFFGCTKLTSVTIGNSVTSIGYSDTFRDCDNLQTIYVQSQVPPVAGSLFGGFFPPRVYKDAILYVPTGTLAAYKIVYPWSEFHHIREMDFSGIEDAEMDAGVGTDEPIIRVENGVVNIDNADGEAPVEVFDISGKIVFRECANMVSGLAKGIYIVKVGDKVQKIRL